MHGCLKKLTLALPSLHNCRCIYYVKCVLKWNRGTVFHLDDVSQPHICLTKNSFLPGTYRTVVGKNRNYFQHFIGFKRNTPLCLLSGFDWHIIFFPLSLSSILKLHTGFDKRHFGVVFILHSFLNLKYYPICS